MAAINSELLPSSLMALPWKKIPFFIQLPLGRIEKILSHICEKVNLKKGYSKQILIERQKSPKRSHIFLSSYQFKINIAKKDKICKKKIKKNKKNKNALNRQK